MLRWLLYLLVDEWCLVEFIGISERIRWDIGLLDIPLNWKQCFLILWLSSKFNIHWNKKIMSLKMINLIREFIELDENYWVVMVLNFEGESCFFFQSRFCLKEVWWSVSDQKKVENWCFLSLIFIILLWKAWSVFSSALNNPMINSHPSASFYSHLSILKLTYFL